MPDTLLLTPEETAAELRIARRRIFELIKSGVLPSVKIGKSRRIRREDLTAYVAGLSLLPAQPPATGGPAEPAQLQRPAAGLRQPASVPDFQAPSGDAA